MVSTRKIRREQERKRKRTERTLRIEYMNPVKLKPDLKNARTHSAEQIAQVAASMKEFGNVNPILATPALEIIAGYARREAAIILKHASVPVIKITGLSDKQQKALAIADNKIALNASWNNELLTSTLMSLDQDDFDLSITGFSTVEIDNLTIADLSEDASGSADDICPLPEARGVSCLGDIWTLGPHRVICGDARDPATFDALLRGVKARMAFLDAPYNVVIDGHASGLGKRRHREFVMASGEMSKPNYIEFLSTTFANTADNCVGGGIIYECMDWRHAPEVYSAAAAANLEVKNLVVWTKTNAGMGTFYRSQHELIFVLKVGSKPHVNNFGLGNTGRYRTNVWHYPGLNTQTRGRDKELAAHPTPKPVALVADAIRDVSNRGDIVLDCFGGSGTTLMAAQKTHRKARLIEVDPIYVDVIVRRWEARTDQQAMHQSGRTFADLTKERGMNND